MSLGKPSVERRGIIVYCYSKAIRVLEGSQIIAVSVSALYQVHIYYSKLERETIHRDTF